MEASNKNTQLLSMYAHLSLRIVTLISGVQPLITSIILRRLSNESREVRDREPEYRS